MKAHEGRSLLRGLYAITPQCEDTDRLMRMVEEALQGGARVVQYRAKSLASNVKATQADALLQLCRERRIPLIINDDVELALAIGADGVHLGREDADLRRVRVRAPGLILGQSCNNEPSRAKTAALNGANYVGIGSMFASMTKPDAMRASLKDILLAKESGGLPVAAIGGITAHNAGEAVSAGADMIAVISALFDAPDIGVAARTLSKHFDGS